MYEVVPREPDYESYLQPARAAVKLVARRFRLGPEETEDLHSDLWARLLADRGRALRRFHGRASVETYLVTVARNLLLDRRNKLWGKWRPSAKAVRGGPPAVELERLIVRDGMAADVALECVRASHPETPHAALDRLRPAIATKVNRRFVGDQVLAGQAASDPSPYDAIGHQDGRRRAARVSAVLSRQLNCLPLADRNLLVWRYLDNRSVAEIARALAVDQKRLYRRCDELLRELRRTMVAAGFDAPAVMDIFGAGHEIGLRVCRQLLPPGGSLSRSA